MEIYNLEVEEDFPCVRECPTTDDKGKDSHSCTNPNIPSPKTPMEQTLMIVESIHHMEKTISARLDMILREIEKLDTKLNVKSNELSRISGQLSDHKQLLKEISLQMRYI